MKTELLIGCGESREKKMSLKADEGKWNNLTTLDFYPESGADVLHDLEVFPYPFEDNSFDEIHAYEVLEHTGQQGDWRFFFDQFAELYRILKPGGYLLGTVPAWNSLWAWADPSHKRVLSHGSFVFLSQDQYIQQVGKTPMTDFRHYWKGDFVPVYQHMAGEHFQFVLQAKK